jgi:hypothetical protein
MCAQEREDSGRYVLSNTSFIFSVFVFVTLNTLSLTTGRRKWPGNYLMFKYRLPLFYAYSQMHRSELRFSTASLLCNKTWEQVGFQPVFPEDGSLASSSRLDLVNDALYLIGYVVSPVYGVPLNYESKKIFLSFFKMLAGVRRLIWVLRPGMVPYV